MNIGEVVKGIFKFLFEDATTALVQPFLSLLQMVALSPETLAKMTWITSLCSVMQAVGMAVLVLITMWQGLKSMYTPFFQGSIEGDEPIYIAMKAFIGVFLVFWMPDILTYIVSIGSELITLIAEEFTNVSAGMGFYELFATILSLNLIYVILMFCLFFKCVGLFFRMFRRLALCGLLILFSPLAAACMVAKPTAGFWQGFVKLFAGNIAIQLLQSGCFVVMQLTLQTITVGGSEAGVPVSGQMESCFGIMLTIAIVSIAGQLEDIVRDISFGVGIGRDMQGAMGKVQGIAAVGASASSIVAKMK